MEYNYRRSRKCLRSFYRDIEDTYDDLSVWKVIWVSPKYHQKGQKRENRGKSLIIGCGEILSLPYFTWLPDQLYQGNGGDEGDRTPYLNAASVALYQMSYVPMCSNFAVQEFPADKFQFKKSDLGKFYQGLEDGVKRFFLMASPRGIEPLLPPWKGGVLDR